MRRFSGGTTPAGEEITWPSISIVPALGGMKPAIMRKVVVLPQPDGPEQRHELARLQLQREVVDRLEVAEALADVPEDELAHVAVRLSMKSRPSARWPIHSSGRVSTCRISARAARYSKFPSSLMSKIITDTTLVLGPVEEDRRRQLARRRDEDQQPGAQQAALEQRRHDPAQRRHAGCRPAPAPPPPSRD